MQSTLSPLQYHFRTTRRVKVSSPFQHLANSQSVNSAVDLKRHDPFTGAPPLQLLGRQMFLAGATFTRTRKDWRWNRKCYVNSLPCTDIQYTSSFDIYRFQLSEQNSLEKWPPQESFLMNYKARTQPWSTRSSTKTIRSLPKRCMIVGKLRRREENGDICIGYQNRTSGTLEMLYRSDLTRSWWLRISVHEAQLLCFWGSTAIYGCICQNYTTNQHLATAPSSNSSYCSLPA